MLQKSLKKIIPEGSMKKIPPMSRRRIPRELPRKRMTTDTGWLVRETIKGLPEAGKKVGGAIGKGVGATMKGAATGAGVAVGAAGRVAKAVAKRITTLPRTTLSPEERKKREDALNKMREIIKQYKEQHPEFKVPGEFKDLE